MHPPAFPGHVNHDIFWTNLAPEKDCRPPGGDLLKGITAKWGSLDKFVADFNAKTAAVQVRSRPQGGLG